MKYLVLALVLTSNVYSINYYKVFKNWLTVTSQTQAISLSTATRIYKTEEYALRKVMQRVDRIKDKDLKGLSKRQWAEKALTRQYTLLKKAILDPKLGEWRIDDDANRVMLFIDYQYFVLGGNTKLVITSYPAKDSTKGRAMTEKEVLNFIDLTMMRRVGVTALDIFK